MTLTEKLDRLPPCICRLLAENNGELATDAEIILRTGWGRKKLDRISRAISWAEITVADVDAFLRVCGISWSSQRREREKLQWAATKSVGGIAGMRHLQNTIAQRASRVTTLLKRTEELLRK